MEAWRVKLSDHEGNFVYVGSYAGTYENALAYAQELRKLFLALDGYRTITFESTDGFASFTLN